MLDELESEIDILLVDTGAGISDTVLYFNLAAQEKVIVVTSEPTSLTDAYALIKVLYTRHGERHFRILVNSVETKRRARGSSPRSARWRIISWTGFPWTTSAPFPRTPMCPGPSSSRGP